MIRDTSAQDRVLAPGPTSPRRRMTWIVAALAVLAVLMLVLPTVGRWLGAERSVSAERLRIAEVRRGTLIRDVSVQGRIVAAVSPTLYAPVAGTVALKTQAGSTVKQGDLLAQIDSPELSNELERERATLQELEVEVQRQRIASERQQLLSRRAAADAGVALSAAQREMQRAEAAWGKHAIAEVEYLRAKDTLRSAEILSTHSRDDSGLEIRGIRFELQTREHQLERQRLVVADLVRRSDELAVRAPVDGVVGTVAVADRAVVAANTPLLIVVDLSRLEVELEVPESYADDLGLGMQAEIRYAGATFPGVLSAISPEVVNGQVIARARFEGELPAGLRQNQRVSTRVLMEEKPDVLLVQRGPFVDSDGGRSAFVVNDDIAQRRAIETGASSMTDVEILSGLDAGERIVISGTDEFADADRILISN
ncbi:MAG: HlyD family efflux transporter periplasmic adaptor subunit [Chiayiivirga sp.]|jgi:HlyD family secretion protein|uniref:efflux RND transporter periplasmic adaptor subunit n=1 Tax=Chiayiivirga sp. TaxID=2041042 RepID=UPI0025C548C9|nr:HlyD family efflux transporter periplasmic adaptor subunit [Chiayiivirga sp.]MCI1711613.1 HlyD family efflux transporter periplasmic adaptor subunit [Chiayiivirga sp.]MCI1730636.1 HlyD family efflux transporter periplasmic adaptor subunit [Chiayiivirga sp.]